MDDEIAKMERMYATSVDDAMPDHYYRYQYAIRFIRPGDILLDAACGSGFGTHYMAAHSACTLAVGVDKSQHGLDWAVHHFFSHKTVYCQTDLSGTFHEELPLPSYDIIICFETVEHMKDDQSFIRKLYQCLNKGGVLLISAPNENVIPHLKNPYFLHGVNPHHFRHYRPKELRNLLVKNGFHIQQAVTQDNETYEIVPGRDDGFTIIYVATK
ncbi:class I SAM-dependent methyltransferase [Paenibacillus sp. ATY16]|uniref:class I SAM-dependent methyltransferase n=1 Tax=Paenibacillus sp. ATY16 TaxID=1759312 RepID=UPI00200C5B00|nr:class I SAM-dependent methyltransferase [Paenibacillus sp. ATY16]MCK9862879.1 class I SAM-dependent methyltransferase [Paenibacillus sp. ATY16]